MAKLARDYFNDLQQKNLTNFKDTLEHDQKLNNVLTEIPERQKLQEPQATRLNWPVMQTQVDEAIHLGKNGSATGLDGCPYKLWKILKEHYNAPKRSKNTESFDIARALTIVFGDIQTYGIVL
jgi:hypothetical protein